jgi:integrase
MTVAEERGGLSRRPKIPHRKEGRGRIRYLLPEEERAMLGLFEQWGMVDMHDAVVVLVDTGLRAGELYRLEPRDVDRNQRLLHIWETKADLPRSVPLTERAFVVVKNRLLRGPKLFPFTHHSFRHHWDRAKVVMGLGGDKQFVPHALRHTCASRLVQRGVPIQVVQQWLGHKTLTVTMRYAHLAPANLFAAVKALESPPSATWP